MENFFESPFKGITLDQQVTNPNIVVGRYSYYSGYYHGHSFNDCVRFLLPGEEADRLIVGSFCSIGSGAAFIMAGKQGHRNDWASSFPFFYMPEVPHFAGAVDAFRPAGRPGIRDAGVVGRGGSIQAGGKTGRGGGSGRRGVGRSAPARLVVGSTPTASSSGAAMPSFCVSRAISRWAGVICGFPAAVAA